MGLFPLNGPFGLCLGQFEDILHHDVDAEDEGLLICVHDERSEFTLSLSGSESRYAEFEIIEERVPMNLSVEGLGQFVYLSSDRFGPRTSPTQSLPKDQLALDYRGN